MATVIEIVKSHLMAEGFGGLVATGASCGCEIASLAPCDGDFSQCEPGYKHTDPRSGHSNDWAIWKQKEPPTAQEWEELCS